MSDTPATTAPRRAMPTPRRVAPPMDNAIKSASPKTFSVSRGLARHAHRVILYGPSGWGKSTLCSLLPSIGIKTITADIEDGTIDLDVERIGGIEDWSDLRAAVQDKSLLAPYDVLVVETASKAEDMCASEIVRTVPGGDASKGLESWDFGKGFGFMATEFRKLIADLDRLYESGKSVILVCHETKARVPNPGGTDYIRFEPLLYAPNKEGSKNNIREEVKNLFADHIFFGTFDVVSTKENKNDKVGKATGESRIIHCQEKPTFIAKSRTLTGPYPCKLDDPAIWKHLFDKE